MARRVIRTVRIGGGGGITDTAGKIGPTPDGGPPVVVATGGPPDQAAAYPSLLKQGANFGRALVKWAGVGFAKRAPEEVQRLASICQACPSQKYDAERERCVACGCPAATGRNWRNKLVIASETCPEGHW